MDVRTIGKWTLSALLPLVLLFWLLAVYWSVEPERFELKFEQAQRVDAAGNKRLIAGVTTTETLVRVAGTLLDKSGGFLANDMMPPSLFMDNLPAWELGALTQVRDLSRSLRKEISRSQSQSVEDADLKAAEQHFNIDPLSWALPGAEDEYRQGIAAVRRYQARIMDPTKPDAQFYARADNLRDWLGEVDKRLGSMSQRLAASVGEARIDLDKASGVAQSTESDDYLAVKTPWGKIDDVFFEARGSCWALIQFLKAAETDFGDVLDKKNARASLRQIIRELEGTQETVWSPMVLNGTGFGFVANHSLVMANYISRADAAIIDLRDLLSRG
ncbi:MAG: DUF2333 family protein [Gammaproteobacteria bacterium]|nr:DUF2333 family protein [Gammaproteobacteria bacterium]